MKTEVRCNYACLLTSTGLKLDTETCDKAIKKGSRAPGNQGDGT